MRERRAFITRAARYPEHASAPASSRGDAVRDAEPRGRPPRRPGRRPLSGARGPMPMQSGPAGVRLPGGRVRRGAEPAAADDHQTVSRRIETALIKLIYRDND